MEIYAAVDASDIAFKSNDYIARDLEERFLPVLVDDLRTNFTKKVEYVAADKSRKELIDTVETGVGAGVIKNDCHMLRVKIKIEVETVSI